MNRVEDSHFWYQGMRKITQSVLNKFIAKKNNFILDAGCGTGANLIFLKKYGRAVGVDISSQAVKFCHLKGINEVKRGSVNRLPYSNRSFDLVTCFDVLGQKHVDDKKAISELYRVTKPGGYIFLRIAAYPFLYSLHDRLVSNEKRYNKDDFLRIIASKKISLLKISYVNMFLFPAIALKRILFKFKTDRQSDVFLLPGWLNNVLLIPLLIEAWLIKYFDFPFGLSLVALVRKERD